MRSRRYCVLESFGLAASFALALPANAGHSASTIKPPRPIVVELFTSQGCDSCPPADALLAQLSARRDLLALSLPVTYWDMMGWKDTLASDANTHRQKEYAQVMGRGGIYTPQIIVDGETDVVGSRDQAVQSAINARMGDMQSVTVDLAANRDLLHVAVGPSWDHAEHLATIWMFKVLPQAKVNIRNGENGGRTITYHNVVRQIRAIGLWKGQPLTLDLPDSHSGAEHDGVAVIVQQGGGYGRIVGAAMLGEPAR
ncbi:MAG TPA: DUF1223 domain-containing protein [Rhizomicrobium sp.]|jgi:hypothetical protein